MFWFAWLKICYFAWRCVDRFKSHRTCSERQSAGFCRNPAENLKQRTEAGEASGHRSSGSTGVRTESSSQARTSHPLLPPLLSHAATHMVASPAVTRARWAFLMSPDHPRLGTQKAWPPLPAGPSQSRSAAKMTPLRLERPCRPGPHCREHVVAILFMLYHFSF